MAAGVGVLCATIARAKEESDVVVDVTGTGTVVANSAYQSNMA